MRSCVCPLTAGDRRQLQDWSEMVLRMLRGSHPNTVNNKAEKPALSKVDGYDSEHRSSVG